MQTTIKHVNTARLEEIREYLLANHKNPELYRGKTKITMDMLRAWASDAEFSLAEGNGPTIEIKSHDSISGCTQTFDVSSAGLDTQLVEIDE